MPLSFLSRSLDFERPPKLNMVHGLCLLVSFLEPNHHHRRADSFVKVVLHIHVHFSMRTNSFKSLDIFFSGETL